VHQTDPHHTLEELRVLPALQGVVVVSEEALLATIRAENRRQARVGVEPLLRASRRG
jgi:hypothetical protein